MIVAEQIWLLINCREIDSQDTSETGHMTDLYG